MIKLLQRQIPFSSSLKSQLTIAIILGFLIALIMIFLKPFDTYRFESNQKNIILGGFGALFSIIYLLTARIETQLYIYLHKRWTVVNEITAFIFLVCISSVPIHFYNQIFLNDLFLQDYGVYEYVRHGSWFFLNAQLPVMVTILPFYVYFRNKLGKVASKETVAKIELAGVNKGEKILLQKRQILFVKSSENYVEIYYNRSDNIQNKTYRNTLAAIKNQAPFLKQCHRSYLVNTSNIKKITGNSQNAKIEFHFSNLEIPLSTTYYKRLKSSLPVWP